MVRCFVGFLLPEIVKEKVVSVQEEIKKLPIVCKFVERENLHICFSFLGNVKEEALEGINSSLSNICKNVRPIRATLDGVKFIPNENFIRVLVLSVVSSELEGLIYKINKEVGGDAKPPHVTLCRVKRVENKNYVVQKLKEVRVEKIDFLVDSVCLIRSELKKGGPTYSIIKEFKLL
jgi:2'-5' RNA ligase|uniref:RNA 2',3'-cyclic phosphodiesterase n=1 Tax=candidate division CPR3 bacterium TaxID=2268181 RepID=A0A7C5YXQ3_UNCC3